ncbi:MAG: hypothetical protein WCK26_02770 [Candidatus Saccharibacteria bacterium]
MTEGLSKSERNFALDREAAFKKYKIQIALTYAATDNKSKITGPVQRFIDNNDSSQNPKVQGRVDAYQAFLDNMSRG